MGQEHVRSQDPDLFQIFERTLAVLSEALLGVHLPDGLVECETRSVLIGYPLSGYEELPRAVRREHDRDPGSNPVAHSMVVILDRLLHD